MGFCNELILIQFLWQKISIHLLSISVFRLLLTWADSLLTEYSSSCLTSMPLSHLFYWLKSLLRSISLLFSSFLFSSLLVSSVHFKWFIIISFRIILDIWSKIRTLMIVVVVVRFVPIVDISSRAEGWDILVLVVMVVVWCAQDWCPPAH